MTEFPTTAARGHDLLREVMAYIETQAEDLLAESPETPSQIDRAGTWRQTVWGTANVPAILKRLGRVPSDAFSQSPVPTEVLVGCGTSMCLAGHAVLMAGDTASINLYTPFVEADFSWVIPSEGGPAVKTPVRAQDLLGLDNADAERLFDEHNTLADLRLFVDQILAGGAACLDCAEGVCRDSDHSRPTPTAD
ncbi:hypothetical protein SEA_VANLEE_120 [Gordonia phage VanLee]|uniref:Uncharacterized protein n=1 Tax=Gordonia phage VanLee TaxID=2845816 RepID=A0A8F2DAG6_9CAUD|nr:hypothetical protein QEH49_gp120 [Gordonia phage VanLee]QWS68237.1 hypothetical protein SEA_VANLEE_120 [Gordonia phage VanLee]